MNTKESHWLICDNSLLSLSFWHDNVSFSFNGKKSIKSFMRVTPMTCYFRYVWGQGSGNPQGWDTFKPSPLLISSMWTCNCLWNVKRICMALIHMNCSFSPILSFTFLSSMSLSLPSQPPLASAVCLPGDQAPLFMPYCVPPSSLQCYIWDNFSWLLQYETQRLEIGLVLNGI